jgi:hypothetical protein
MNVDKIEIVQPKDLKDRARLTATIVYESHGSEVHWFDVPLAYSDYLATSGNPWLACLLPLAVTR